MWHCVLLKYSLKKTTENPMMNKMFASKKKCISLISEVWENSQHDECFHLSVRELHELPVLNSSVSFSKNVGKIMRKSNNSKYL